MIIGECYSIKSCKTTGRTNCQDYVHLRTVVNWLNYNFSQNGMIFFLMWELLLGVGVIEQNLKKINKLSQSWNSSLLTDYSRILVELYDTDDVTIESFITPQIAGKKKITTKMFHFSSE